MPLGLWMKFMMVISTCMLWILLTDRQLSFVCDTEATVRTEGLEYTALAKGMGLISPIDHHTSLAISYHSSVPKG